MKKKGGGGRGGETRGGPTKGQERANPSPEGAEQSTKAERPGKKGETHQKRAQEAGPPDPVMKDEHTHTRTGPGRGVLRPARGGVGVHTKQPRCTGRVPRRKTDGTGNRTHQ